jgi:hypothetical protein
MAIDLDLGTDDATAEDGNVPSKQERYSRAVKYYLKAASLGNYCSPYWRPSLTPAHIGGYQVMLVPISTWRYVTWKETEYQPTR